MSQRYPLSWSRRLACLFFPERCLLCGRVVHPGVLFCAACEEALPPRPALRRIGMPGREPLPTAAVMPYRGRWRRCLLRYKFQGCRSLARQLGWLMAQAGADLLGGEFDAAVYVPLGKKRLREREYDQSQLLARNIGLFLGVPVLDALEKVKDTKTQHELGRAERLHNLDQAFRCSMDLTGRRVLLVDDIVTTGATLRECAKELYRAGAIEVCCLCTATARFAAKP